MEKKKRIRVYTEEQKERNRVYANARYLALKNNPEWQARKKAQQKRYREAHPEKMKEWRKTNPERMRELCRRTTQGYKARCLDHYGNTTCACCGEKRMDFLCIDHINGGGNKHRREIGTNLIRWLIKNNLPEGPYRVLCHNCNFAIGAYGICPHEKEKK